MAQALFEVQTFDGHGWVTLHRGTDLDAAGEAARRVLPEAKKRAVRILRQRFDTERAALDREVVFSLGKPRKPVFRRAVGVAAAFSATLAAILAATMIDQADPDALVAMITDSPATQEAPAAPVLAEAVPETAQLATAPAVRTNDPQLATLVPGAGDAPFDCDREAERGLVRASNIDPARERLYDMCAGAVAGDAEAQMALAASLAAGDAAEPDPAQAIRWYQEAARGGTVAAFRPLADQLMAAATTEADRDRGIAWYHRAALAGDLAAAGELARRYRTGDGVDVDDRVALSYDLIAAEAGDPAAMLRAAEAFAAGTGTEIDTAAAQRWIARAAEAGDATATARVAEAQPVPALAWSSPAVVDANLSGAAARDVPAMSWSAPGAAFGLTPNPDLSFEYDRDARELGTGFAAAIGSASV